jgi:hypothetical protein
MTQEQRELLLKDLCSRLPYGVKASFYGMEEECECCDVIDGIYPFDNEILIGQYALKVEAIKPYLLPLSSMTEKQRKELTILKTYVSFNKNKEYLLFDWLNANHFDYRKLIEKSLALDATGLGIY